MLTAFSVALPYMPSSGPAAGTSPVPCLERGSTMRTDITKGPRFPFAGLTQKELDRLQEVEREFNRFLRSQGRYEEVYLVAYGKPEQGPS